MIKHAENLRNGDGPGTGWRYAADLINLIRCGVVNAQRRTLFGLVAGQIIHAQLPWVASVALHGGDHGAGGVALHKARLALRSNLAQHGGVLWVFKGVADGQWFAIGQVKVGRCDRVFGEVSVFGDQGVEAFADRKALFSELNSGCEQCGPRQLAVLAVRLGQHGHEARYANGATTDEGGLKGQRATIRTYKKFFINR